jgi:hypothetical protein
MLRISDSLEDDPLLDQRPLEVPSDLVSVGKLASQSIPSWNQIISWLKEMETLRTIAA